MITLKNGSIYQSVATQREADILTGRGYTFVSGSAESTPDVSLHTLPDFIENATDPHNPTFRGIGLTAEATNTLGYLKKACSVGLSFDAYNILEQTFTQDSKSAGSYTAIVPVEALPTSNISATKYYLLTEQDDANLPGVYYYTAAVGQTDAFWTKL